MCWMQNESPRLLYENVCGLAEKNFSFFLINSQNVYSMNWIGTNIIKLLGEDHMII